MLLCGIFGMAWSTLFTCFVDSKNFICFGLSASCRNHADFDELIPFFWIITVASLSIIDIGFFLSISSSILLYADLTSFFAEQQNSYLQLAHSSLIFLKVTSIFSL